MSGAGRGTPRVSPASGVAPVRPGGGDNPFGQITVLPDVPFRFDGPGGDALTLTSAFQNYAFSPPVGVTYNVPDGCQRVALRMKYTEGAAGGQMLLRFLDGGGRATLYPTTQSNVGDIRANTEMRELRYLIADTNQLSSGLAQGFVYLPARLITSQFSIQVAEVGVPATPGEFEVRSIIADNIGDNVLFNNISV